MPAVRPPTLDGEYDLYPAFPLPSGRVLLGFDALAEQLAPHPLITIDGSMGVFWEHLRAQLDEALERRGVRAVWTDIAQALKPLPEISRLVAPFLGDDDPLFGTRFTGTLGDFFDPERLRTVQPHPGAAHHIVYGTGAALAGWAGHLVYVDLPRNELQFRARAGAATNLGANAPAGFKPMYKRFYFIDRVALDAHKARLLPALNLLVDGQRPDEPAMISGADLRAGLGRMSRSCFRARPWFEPGAWGGNWIKQHVPALPQEAPNYAWSFELITPENGLLFESDNALIECSFDFLMAHSSRAVLGDCADVFGLEFPIRFDFLDTWEGGNLSVQCHPGPDYIRRHFGERFTQDETYYLLDCQPDALVGLGFREDIDPAAFRQALEHSHATSTPLDMRDYLHFEPAHKHDLFLIPHGTVHCAGQGSLVLEISATPYIFTFKMYDWMRADLDGRPRPLNIERAFANLRFDRKGAQIQRELVSRPVRLAQGSDWQLVHLPTHADHFYDVHRFEFSTSVTAETQGSCHILSLVEGQSVQLQTTEGFSQRFHFAETFVVPAAAGGYTLTNLGRSPAKVVKAFVKAGYPFDVARPR
jgi:mannose-6-phosphate isomerase class I